MERDAKPVDAATVVLARDPEPGAVDWECFMVRRHVRSEFAPDVFVFPGGKVDESDRDPALLRRVSGDDLPPHKGQEGPMSWLALKMAAIRELFEEAGVLLAETATGPVKISGTQDSRFDEYRRKLQTGAMGLEEMADIEGLTFAAYLLTPFAHWITPLGMPRRYDTWFFVARAPASQIALHDAHETTDSTWINPGEALKRSEEGDFPLVFATRMQLRRLAKCDSVDALLNSITDADLEPIAPRVVEEAGETRFLLPGDPGYDDSV